MSSSASAAKAIRPFADPNFDAFAEWERSICMVEVENPYPRLAELREQAAVHAQDVRELFGLPPIAAWQDVPTYTILGYDEALEVLERPDIFSNSILAELYANGFGANNLHAMDPPTHTMYRRIFQKAFLPKYIQAWRDELLPSIIEHFIDGFAGDGHAELIEQFCKKFPFHFVFGLLDLPREDQQTFHELAISLIATANLGMMAEASRSLGEYLLGLLQARRANPGKDLISILGQVEVDGLYIPDDIIVSFLRQLLTAGGGTTFHATGTMLVGILRNRETQWEALRADRSLIPAAVEEALRWDSPSMTVMRCAMENTSVGGVAIQKGARIVILVSAINRKPFADSPGENDFDIHRQGLREKQLNLAFSHGPHICIGRHLAQMEMGIALNTLLDRFPDMRADPDYPPPVVRGLITRTPSELYVVFDPS